MNPLYLQAKKFATDAASSQLKCTTTGSKYFLYEFASASFAFEFNRERRSLSDHHLSIHEVDEPENHYLSAYHYTAYFNSQTTRYQLHVYFDRKDEILAIQFAQLTASGKNVMALNDEQKKILLARATKTAYSFVRPFRAEVQTHLIADKKKLEFHIRQIATANSPRQYRELVSTVIDCLSGIGSYDLHASYAYQLKYYRRMLRQIPLAVISPSKERKPVLAADSDTEATACAVLESPCKQATTPTKTKISLTPEIARLMQEFSQCASTAINAEIIESLLPRLLMLYQESYLTDASRGERQYIVTTEDEHNLDTLLQDIEKQRLDFFQRLIMFKKYSGARSLMAAEQIEEHELSKLVYLSLNTANHELLDFLLTHYEYPINTSEFKSLSPAMYCLKRSATMPQISKCFEILIKHKVSLDEQDPETSMSIMGTILFTPNHPLKPAQGDIDFLPSPRAEIARTTPCRQRKPSTQDAKQYFRCMGTFFQSFVNVYDEAASTLSSSDDLQEVVSVNRGIQDKLKRCGKMAEQCMGARSFARR